MTGKNYTSSVDTVFEIFEEDENAVGAVRVIASSESGICLGKFFLELDQAMKLNVEPVFIALFGDLDIVEGRWKPQRFLNSKAIVDRGTYSFLRTNMFGQSFHVTRDKKLDIIEEVELVDGLGSNWPSNDIIGSANIVDRLKKLKYPKT